MMYIDNEVLEKMIMTIVEGFDRIEKKLDRMNRLKDCLEGWIDNQEACIMMDISPRKLLSLRSTGKIPYSKIDRKIYYRKKDINMYMEKLLQKGNY